MAEKIEDQQTVAEILEMLCDWYMIFNQDRSFFVGENRRRIYADILNHDEDEATMRTELRKSSDQIFNEAKILVPEYYVEVPGARDTLVERVIAIWRQKQRADFKDKLCGRIHADNRW